MKTKILPLKKKENTIGNYKKIEKLTEKLANHFKVRLAPLLEEKKYKYSQLILDIGCFWEKRENFNLETELIVPKMEKYLIEILSRPVQDNNRYDSDYILKTEGDRDRDKSVKNANRKILNLQNNRIYLAN